MFQSWTIVAWSGDAQAKKLAHFAFIFFDDSLGNYG